MIEDYRGPALAVVSQRAECGSRIPERLVGALAGIGARRLDDYKRRGWRAGLGFPVRATISRIALQQLKKRGSPSLRIGSRGLAGFTCRRMSRQRYQRRLSEQSKGSIAVFCSNREVYFKRRAFTQRYSKRILHMSNPGFSITSHPGVLRGTGCCPALALLDPHVILDRTHAMHGACKCYGLVDIRL